MTDDLVLLSTESGVRTVTLNRPEARNALDSSLMAAFAAALQAAEDDDDVDAVVVTGTDPAFCAGLDLRELGSTGANLTGTDQPRTGGDDGRAWNPFTVLWKMETPIVGAVNGPAVTGGLEIALNCDFLVASERAAFADTHARVGVLPGGGMTPLLPQAVGLRRAKEMSLTGNFVSAEQARDWGLVNHVVAHEECVVVAQALAADVAANDRRAVRRLRRNYNLGSQMTVGEFWALEREEFRTWRVDFSEIERRRGAIVERGRGQAGE